ncbi:MAG: type II secretion system protein [bacterium]|nr:type II secretion system protein [bacterium]
MKTNKEIFKQRGFALIAILVAVLVIGVIAFGTIKWQGQIQQSKQIENQAVKNLQKINDNFEKNNQAITKNLTEEPEVVDTNDWQIYYNEKYGYQYKTPVNRSSFEVLTVEAVKQPIDEYAQEIWQINKDDNNPNIKNKFISNLLTTKVDGRDAFTFNIIGSFQWQTGGWQIEKERTFIFTANKLGTVFLINFLKDDKISQEILKTFKINEDWVKPKVVDSQWLQYSKLSGVSFKYPGTVFSIAGKEENYVYFNSKRGTLSLTLTDKKLDPNNIEDMYGKIEKFETIKVGNNAGYKYKMGDAGCLATIVKTAVSDKTLVISFGSCPADLYYIDEDNDLQKQILATFKFTN